MIVTGSTTRLSSGGFSPGARTACTGLYTNTKDEKLVAAPRVGFVAGSASTSKTRPRKSLGLVSSPYHSMYIE